MKPLSLSRSVSAIGMLTLGILIGNNWAGCDFADGSGDEVIQSEWIDHFDQQRATASKASDLLGRSNCVHKTDPCTTVLRVQGDTTVVDRATGKPVDGLLRFKEQNGVVKLVFRIVEY